MVTEQFIIVAYDISSDKRRQKVAKILENYGHRVNYSVFECMLHHAKAETMKQELYKAMKEGKDTILLYSLCKHCINHRSFLKGKKEKTELVKIL